MEVRTLFGQFRLLAILEGISFISFGLTMPLKYLMDIKGPNYVVGMIHGFLFLAYVVYLLINHFDKQWSLSKSGLLFIASLLPFGTFVADAKLLRQQK